MTTTLTIRTSPTLKEALSRRAESKGLTSSEMARQILAEALTARPLGEKVGHLRGKLGAATQPEDSWQKSIRAQNWRS